MAPQKEFIELGRRVARSSTVEAARHGAVLVSAAGEVVSIGCNRYVGISGTHVCFEQRGRCRYQVVPAGRRSTRAGASERGEKGQGGCVLSC